MYCASCGSEVQEGLRYCNRCGANLAAETAAPRLFGIVMVLALAVLLVGLVGILALFFFAVEVMGRGTIPIETVVFLVVFALVVFTVEFLLIRQFSRILGVYLNESGTESSKKKEAKVPKQMPEARQDFVSPDSPHTTASEEKTRRFDSEEATRKLDE